MNKQFFPLSKSSYYTYLAQGSLSPSMFFLLMKGREGGKGVKMHSGPPLYDPTELLVTFQNKQTFVATLFVST